ncbi:MAG TPA: hypothetical protein PKX00_13185 [Opitutaceae bacterium]|nr:hypothetical protein [Opitutaceae bacterium]
MRITAQHETELTVDREGITPAAFDFGYGFEAGTVLDRDPLGAGFDLGGAVIKMDGGEIAGPAVPGVIKVHQVHGMVLIRKVTGRVPVVGLDATVEFGHAAQLFNAHLFHPAGIGVHLHVTSTPTFLDRAGDRGVNRHPVAVDPGDDPVEQQVER